jgi:hypothetical protein
MVEARQALQHLLAGLGEASHFVSVGQFSAVLPGLEVKGVGPIGAPVTAADAKRIITKASQTPYGRGEATIVDTDVRRVWQLHGASTSASERTRTGPPTASMQGVDSTPFANASSRSPPKS